MARTGCVAHCCARCGADCSWSDSGCGTGRDFAAAHRRRLQRSARRCVKKGPVRCCRSLHIVFDWSRSNRCGVGTKNVHRIGTAALVGAKFLRCHRRCFVDRLFSVFVPVASHGLLCAINSKLWRSLTNCSVSSDRVKNKLRQAKVMTKLDSSAELILYIINCVGVD